MERRLPEWFADGIIAVGLFVLSLGMLRDYAATGLQAEFSRQTDALSLLLIAMQTLPLAVRRRYPIAVTVIVVVGFLVDRGLDYPSTFAGIGTLMAVHAVGSELPPRRSAIVGMSIVGGVTAYTLLGVVLYDSVSIDDALFVFLTGLVALYLGREVHQRRQQAAALARRAERAEREREERARAAVADERARIARELHDVVAHELAVMTVQAEGALRIAPDSDPRVHTALLTIRNAGREALAEMRRMVGLLRSTDSSQPLAPQPGLGELDRLVEQFGRAGMLVSVHVEGEPRRLPSGVDLSAYRIIQESLTNALKHGGARVSAEVRLDYRDDGLSITVADDGSSGPEQPPARSGGHGLIGMRERVSLLSGQLEAGPRAGGGFEVRASIPVAP